MIFKVIKSMHTKLQKNDAPKFEKIYNYSNIVSYLDKLNEK